MKYVDVSAIIMSQVSEILISFKFRYQKNFSLLRVKGYAHVRFEKDERELVTRIREKSLCARKNINVENARNSSFPDFPKFFSC